ncbi:MAG: helix-turn-helix domain-containing protein [Polyangiaceae bacterium]|nr:helix-turn-helix domain-containing protein [Polyangiaceae bacterium]
MPNPPAVFVGRERERAALSSALARAPLTVLHGPSGVGKTALALTVLASREPSLDESTLVSLRDADRHELLALAVARTLARAAEIERVDWAELGEDRDALIALVIDAAEARAGTVLLDGLDHADASDADALIARVARYARRSRWLVTTTRRPPVDELAGQLVEVGALPPEDARRLACALNPSWDDAAVERALTRARGSPRELRRLALGEPEVPAGASSHLTPEAAALSAALLEQEEPLSGRALALLLEAHPEPRVRLGALGALIAGGALTRAAALLGEIAPALIGGGHAAALFGALPEHERALERFRLEAALGLGDSRSLSTVREPLDDAPEGRLAWARVLLARGSNHEAARVARSLSERPEVQASPTTRFSVGFVLGNAHLNDGDSQRARAVLESLAPSCETEAAQRDSLLAAAFALAGDRAEATSLARAAAAVIPRLPCPMSERIGLQTARTLYSLGELEGAATVLDGLFSDQAASSIRFYAGRYARFLRMCIAVDAGDFERVEASLTDLEPYLGPNNLLHPYVLTARAQLAIGRGELARAEALLDELTATPRPGHVEREVRVQRTWLAMLRREPPSPAPDEPGSSSPPNVFEESGELHRLEHRLRYGALAPSTVEPLLDGRFEHPELRVLARLVLAEARLLARDAAGAFTHATTALAMAREHGYGVRALQALILQADTAIVLGRREALERSAASLDERARAMRSTHAAARAQLYAALLTLGVARYARLEALAAAVDAAPDVTLLARGLLGDRVAGDRVDDLVREGAARHFGWHAPRLAVDGAGEAWGLALEARAVWLASGELIDLSRHPVQWSLLDALVRHGGAADKERLVLEVWRARDYHPLRDDNRLHAAIRKLRRQLETEPSNPRRVVTAESGYALGGRVRVAEG